MRSLSGFVGLLTFQLLCAAVLNIFVFVEVAATCLAVGHSC
jgi:hypothetical protein